MKMYALGALSAIGLVIVACSGDTTNVGGVAGNAGSDAGSPDSGSGGTGGSAGSGGSTGGTAGSGGSAGGGCPADISAAVGKPCSEEGKFCGGENCDPCSFCNMIKCTNGKWEQLEAFPDPNCSDAGQSCNGVADVDCPADSYCDIGDLCGNAPGTCVKKPTDCSQECTEVCGCDGKKYCNACLAQSKGVDVTSSNSCAPGTGAEGSLCSTDFQCQSGLKCCYPCGIEGCQFQCMKPEPNGMCPLFP